MELNKEDRKIMRNCGIALKKRIVSIMELNITGMEKLERIEELWNCVFLKDNVSLEMFESEIVELSISWN